MLKKEIISKLNKNEYEYDILINNCIKEIDNSNPYFYLYFVNAKKSAFLE
jgi:hypothetical protein